MEKFLDLNGHSILTRHLHEIHLTKVKDEDIKEIEFEIIRCFQILMNVKEGLECIFEIDK